MSGIHIHCVAAGLRRSPIYIHRVSMLRSGPLFEAWKDLIRSDSHFALISAKSRGRMEAWKDSLRSASK